MDKKDILKTFNQHFFEFIEDVITIIDDNKDIKYARDFFKTVQSFHSVSIIKTWYNYVYFPYKNHIDNGDIDYFLNKDYTTDLNDVSTSRDEIIQAIDKLRTPIKNMSATNQQHATQYIQNLSKLAELYYSM